MFSTVWGASNPICGSIVGFATADCTLLGVDGDPPNGRSQVLAYEPMQRREQEGISHPTHIVQLECGVLADAVATAREVKLARWVLLSTLKDSGEG